jgi:hypothetical protein
MEREIFPLSQKSAPFDLCALGAVSKFDPLFGSLSSVVEHRLHTAGVVGSNPTVSIFCLADLTLGRFFQEAI